MSEATVKIEVKESDVVFISVDGEGKAYNIAKELLELAKDADIDSFIGKNNIKKEAH